MKALSFGLFNEYVTFTSAATTMGDIYCLYKTPRNVNTGSYFVYYFQYSGLYRMEIDRNGNISNRSSIIE